ncbi:PH domain-containing protein [Rufibacter sp. XAAS-G3-1]|uniref:PH domain-containing protein n=1 Tax=Rufibacter sp. XAAS-G3-1 TaxID=2729134 RepID=UPI0015E6B9DF|nr:PH domain-containing protein [Rufibacter sp. XAAS-G3-1]
MTEKSIVVHPTSGYALLLNIQYLLIIPFVIFGSTLFPDFIEYILAIGVFGLSIVLYNYYYLRQTVYELTKSRLKYSRGIFTLTTDFIELYRVKDIVQMQPFLLRLIGTMNLTILSSDRSHPHLVLKGIPLSNLADTLREVVEMARKDNRVFEVD